MKHPLLILIAMTSGLLRDTLAICKKRNGWSDAAAEIAGTLAMSRPAQPAIENALTTDAVSVAAVIAAYRGLSEAVRKEFATGQPSDAGGMAAAQAVDAVKVSLAKPRGELIGMMLTALAFEEFKPAAFAAA